MDQHSTPPDDVTPPSGEPPRRYAAEWLASIAFVVSVALWIIDVAPSRSLYLGVVTRFSDKYPGLFALGSLVIIILAAPFLYRPQRQHVRHLVLPLAVASAVLFTASLPELLADSPGAIWLQILAILGLVWLIAKLLLLHRFSAMYRCRPILPEVELARLPPFQELDLKKLRKAIIAEGNQMGSRVIQLAGRWGQGKTFVIERLETFLRREARVEGSEDDCAVAVINVWEQQSEPDLHLAIVEQILSHKSYWHPYGWLHYPLSLIAARVIKEWRLTLSAGAATKAEVQLPLTVPPPTGRRQLEQQVSRVRRRGTRTIIVLDEIDRAAPRVAQSAVTLVRRSLDMPGVVVILSYVDQIMRYKAFNPLINSLPDLGSTMHAVIFDEGPERASGSGVKPTPGPRPGGPLTESHQASLRKWEAWEKAADGRPGKADASPSGDGKESWRDPADSDDGRLSEALRLAFANARFQRANSASR